MFRLRIRQGQFGHLLAILVVLHLHFFVEAFWSCVVKEMHRVVVHAGHREVPLRLLVIREITRIVGCDEVCLRYTSWKVDFHYGYHWRETRREYCGLKHAKEMMNSPHLSSCDLDLCLLKATRSKNIE